VKSAEPAAPPLDPYTLREDFPILARQVREQPLVYFDNAATAQRPRRVIEAMTRMYEQDFSNVHRGIHTLSERSTNAYEDARTAVCDFLGAESREEIIFTAGCTASINLVARSWGEANLRSGDLILVTEMEHHANLVPWHQLAQRTGAAVAGVAITDEGRLDFGSLDAWLARGPKVVAFTGVSNVLGVRNDVKEIVRRSRDAGAVTMLDAAQLAPHEPMNVQELGADFVAFSGHKMMGPTGIGVLYGQRRLLDEMPPFLGGGAMIDTVEIDRFTPARLPVKFEAGTPAIVEAVGLVAALGYLSEVGLARIHDHEQRLASRAHALLGAAGDVRFLGPPPSEKAGIVSFVVEGIHPSDLAQALDHQGVAIRSGHHCAMPLHRRFGIAASCRASFYLYNTLEEVERFAQAVDKARGVFHGTRRRRKRPPVT